MSSVPISLVTRVLDRIQISIAGNMGIRGGRLLYREIIRHFSDIGFPLRYQKKSAPVRILYPLLNGGICPVKFWRVVPRWTGIVAGSLIIIRKSRHHWTRITVMQPSRVAQERLLEALSSTPSLRSRCYAGIYLSQVEFAVDIYPEDPKHLWQLEHDVGYRIVRKFARAHSYSRFNNGGPYDTHYFGTEDELHGHKKVNVRKGAYGIRAYQKPKNGPRKWFRIELQAHLGLLKQKGMDIHSLPLVGNELNPFDYVTFQEFFNLNAPEILAAAAMRKQKQNRPKGKPTPPKVNPRIPRLVFTQADRDEYRQINTANVITDKITEFAGGRGCYPDGIEDIPVAHIYSVLKAAVKRYHVSVPMRKFFRPLPRQNRGLGQRKPT